VPRHPALLAGRTKGIWATGVKPWDKLITTLAGGLMLLLWMVAGLDVRRQWTGALPVAYHAGGLLGTLLGYGLFMWAMASNPFFAEGVRLPHEREHAVATGGPYQYVRHPGYAGTMLAYVATPFLLGSLWACLLSIAMVVLFVVRPALEDRTLMGELPGYQAYARHIRYRLVPGVW
jgi:protein-S-isoprenylcysteine O-methyltransferase Ste14